MRHLTAILGILMLVAVTCGESAETPDALAEEFIAAVNEKSREKQQAIIHPRCFVGLSELQKKFLDETLSRDFRKVVPEERTVTIRKLEGSVLPFAEMMEWPVTPTHKFEIEFKTGDYASTTLIRFIAGDKGEWFIIVPVVRAPKN